MSRAGKGEESGWMVGREGIECVRICVSSVISFSALIFIASFAWSLLTSALVVFYSVWKFENESGRSFNVFRWSEGGPVERSGLCGGKGGEWVVEGRGWKDSCWG